MFFNTQNIESKGRCRTTVPRPLPQSPGYFYLSQMKVPGFLRFGSRPPPPPCPLPRGQDDSPLLKKVLTMKLKEMEEMAKQARKTSTSEGSLCVSTATSFFTCATCRPRGQYAQVTAGKVETKPGRVVNSLPTNETGGDGRRVYMERD